MGMISLTIDKEWNIALHVLRGDVDYTEIHAAIEQFYKGTLTRYTIWDFTDAVVDRLTIGDIQRLGSEVSTAGKARLYGADVLIVSNQLKFGFARIYAAYADLTHTDPAALKTGVVRSRDEAYAWIKQHKAKHEQ